MIKSELRNISFENALNFNVPDSCSNYFKNEKDKAFPAFILKLLIEEPVKFKTLWMKGNETWRSLIAEYFLIETNDDAGNENNFKMKLLEIKSKKNDSVDLLKSFLKVYSNLLNKTRHLNLFSTLKNTIDTKSSFCKAFLQLMPEYLRKKFLKYILKITNQRMIDFLNTN